MKGYLDVKELEGYKKADIQKLARDLGVSDAGTIKEIAARCAAVEIETGAGEPPTEPGKAAGEQAEERTGQQTGDWGRRHRRSAPDGAGDGRKGQGGRDHQRHRKGAGRGRKSGRRGKGGSSSQIFRPAV